jgi:hypothetical protein
VRARFDVVNLPQREKKTIWKNKWWVGGDSNPGPMP